MRSWVTYPWVYFTPSYLAPGIDHLDCNIDLHLGNIEAIRDHGEGTVRGHLIVIVMPEGQAHRVGRGDRGGIDGAARGGDFEIAHCLITMKPDVVTIKKYDLLNTDKYGKLLLSLKKKGCLSTHGSRLTRVYAAV